MSMPWEDFAPASNTSSAASGPWDDFKPQSTQESSGSPFGDSFNNAVGQVTSQPEFQPFQGGIPKVSDVLDTKNPSALGQVMGTARKMVSLPARFSQTLGSASEPVSNAVTEGLGYGSARVGHPLPAWLSATAGMAGGMAADPRSYIPGGGVAKEQSSFLPDSVAEAREARTGVPARQFKALYKDPSAIWAGDKQVQAGQAIGEAKEAAGINPGITHDVESLTPENLDRINPTKAVKIDDISTVLQKIKDGTKPSPQEAQNALDSINSILNTKLPDKVFRQWTIVKGHINNALQDVAPDVRAANQAFAHEALGNDFAGMDAVNKNGKPSKLGLIARGGAGLAGALAGHLIPGMNTPEGIFAGYQAAKYANQAYHAPFVAGLQTAAGAYADRFLNPAISGAEKTVTSPAVLAYVQRYLAQKNQGTKE